VNQRGKVAVAIRLPGSTIWACAELFLGATIVPKELFCVVRINVFEISWEGSLPVEPGLGSVSGLSRRFGGSVVLVIVEVSVKVSVETARGQTGCLES